MPAPISQLLSRTVYATDGTTTVWDFAFSGGYLDDSHVKAYVETPAGARTPIVITSGMLIGPFQVEITPALAAGDTLVVYRDTPKDLPLVDFTDESGLSEIALDTNAKQAVFIAAESSDEVALLDISLAVDAVEQAAAFAAAAGASASGAVSSAVASGTFADAAEGSANDAADSAALAAAAGSAAADTLRADLAASSGAGLIGYDEDGTYAVGTLGSEIQRITGPHNSVVTCYGDSFTMGVSGGITYDQAYINLIAVAKNWIIPIPPDFAAPGKGSTSIGNQAFGGSQIASTEQIDRIMNHQTAAADIQFILTGFNDVRAYGMAQSGRSTYRQTLQAALAWMAIPASHADKLFADESNTALVLRSGAGWVANATWFNGQGYHTGAAGDSFNCTVFGDTIYLALPRDIYTTGKCDITVDGVNYGEYDYSGSTQAVQYTKTYSMGFVRIAGLKRGFHGVILTKTSAATGTDFMRVDWVAGVDGRQSAQGVEGGPQVYVGNCCRMTTAGYASGSPTWSNADDNVVDAYNTMIEQCVRELAADGLNIAYVDACQNFDPNSADLAADGIHPSAIGMQKIANAFLERMDAGKVHAKDRGTVARLQEFVSRRVTNSSLGTVTELGDLGRATNFAGGGLQTTMSHNVQLVDGQYFRINDGQPAWMIVIDNTVTGPTMRYAAAGPGQITVWDKEVRIDNVTQEAWTVPVLTNGWADISGAWATTGYMKDTMGFVHLRGLIAGGTLGVPALSLPAGYTPAGKSGFPIVAAGAFGWVTIDGAGVVQVEAGSTAWASLNGISFKAA